MTIELCQSLGYIIQQRPYKNTSVLLDMLTRDHGKICCVASGGRANLTRWQGVLQPFSLLQLTWQKRVGLGTLKEVSSCERQLLWRGLPFVMAMYLNELTIHLLPQGQGDEAFFFIYRQLLGVLSRTHSVKAKVELELESQLRRFEYQLLKTIGYELVLEQDVKGRAVLAQQNYWLRVEHLPEHWPVNRPASIGLVCQGASLLALKAGKFDTELEKMDAKRIMRMYLQFYLHNRTLKSRELFKQFKGV
ncbi:DNA repair protein RecO [Piscirickettsia salmonis]|uniref:DNA repair protein RecO n=1 Tax=Piscirickettsia salmonis TaxID=1238 RepID=UPI000F086B65|nr:DNA repair protein RecO [Piscirickettsiaceae bacterium NZ-RLO2]